MRFEDIKYMSKIYLYCGDMPPKSRMETGKGFVGLSLTRDDRLHIMDNSDTTKNR